MGCGVVLCTWTCGRRLNRCGSTFSCSLRDRYAAATTAAAADAIPPTINDQRGPATCATQPTSGAPIGVPPMNTIKYNAITRPRITGETDNCTLVLAAVDSVSVKNPNGTRTAKNVQYDGISAATTSSTPDAAAAMNTNRRAGLPRRADASAPSREPNAYVAEIRP